MELLAKIETFEKAELDRLSGPRPTEPPALIEEPSELIDTPTAYGGWWRRRKYADGTVSAPYFRRNPPPRFVNEAEYVAAWAALHKWGQNRGNLWAQVRLLSGSARNWFNGNRAGRRGGKGPEQTVEELEAHYGARIAAAGYLSQSARYAAELLEAAKVLA